MEFGPDFEMAHYQEIPCDWSMPESLADDSTIHGPTLSQPWLTMGQEMSRQFGGIESSRTILQPGLGGDVLLGLDNYGLETPATQISVPVEDWSNISDTCYYSGGASATDYGLLNNTSSLWGLSFTPPSAMVTFEALSESPSSEDVFWLFPNSPATSMTSCQSSSFPTTEWLSLPTGSTLNEHMVLPTEVPDAVGMARSKSQPRRRPPRHQQDDYPRLPKRVWRKLERPEKCPHCRTGFPFQADLTKHIQVHHSADQNVPRPVYTCVIAACKKTYHRSDHLYRHGIKKHDWPPGGQRQTRRAVSRSKNAR